MLTTIEAAEGEPGIPRGFLKVGAGTLVRHQLTLALALECQLIVCIARGLGPELIELLHCAEKAGARFQVVSGARALASLVAAQDDVFVVADGLLALPRTARDLVEAGHAVLVQPVESGTSGGFERVDVNHASAGLLRIPGGLVERLSELPPDCDVASALTRIALQAGIAQRPLPAGAHDGFGWSLVRNENEAHRIEAGWIGLHLAGDGPLTAGSAVARLGVRLAGPALLHAGSGGNALALGALAVLLLAFGAGWAGYCATALILCALAWTARRTSGMLLLVERESLGLGAERWSREAVFGWLLDLCLVVTLGWSPQGHASQGATERLFVPFMLICVLRLLPRIVERPWMVWARDRAVLAILLAMASGAGVLDQAVHVLAAGLALAGILMPGKGRG